MQIPLNMLYLWKKKGGLCRYPWQRYLNQDFLKYELKQIEKMSQWRIEFTKAKVKQFLDKLQKDGYVYCPTFGIYKWV